jgi:transcriptional repressor NrdR
MKCPNCASRDTKVIDKRDSDEGAHTRRRRECPTCNQRFTTYERAETHNLMIAKKDGRRQEFDRAKLRGSIQKACTKRPIASQTIERMVDQIEAELRGRDVLEINSATLGDLVMEKLRGLDHVAYIRFASVYRAFADLSSFEQELAKLLRSEAKAEA